MVVLRPISLVKTPPSVSMPSESGVTSRSRTSVTSPAKTPPYHPHNTAELHHPIIHTHDTAELHRPIIHTTPHCRATPPYHPHTRRHCRATPSYHPHTTLPSYTALSSTQHYTTLPPTEKKRKPQHVIIIIIIKNVKIRVTLSWVTLQGHFTECRQTKQASCYADRTTRSCHLENIIQAWICLCGPYVFDLYFGTKFNDMI